MKSAIWRALHDEGVTSMLLDIVRAHVRLAIEYSNNTSPCRRDAIKAEIQRLRTVRDGILERIVSTNDHRLQSQLKHDAEHVGNLEHTTNKKHR